MKTLVLSLAALVGLSSGLAWADSCSSCGTGKCCHCMEPKTFCPDCGDPCCHCRIPAIFGQCHTQKLLDQICSGDCCGRIHAAKKLGCCLHADFCACPEVLSSLIHALQCDSCWKVRQKAAWGIAHQKARVKEGVVALYLASKLDPHYMVRDAAADALDVLLVCRRDCFKDLFTAADELAKVVKKAYKPTSGSCVNLVAQVCASVEGQGPMIIPSVEPIAAPKIERLAPIKQEPPLPKADPMPLPKPMPEPKAEPIPEPKPEEPKDK